LQVGLNNSHNGGIGLSECELGTITKNSAG